MKAAELLQVTNCWTVYAEKLPDGQLWSEMGRPQDWGDPKWMYRAYVLEAQGYRNTVHCWHDAQINEAEFIQMFAPLICTILIPGVKPELAGRDFLDEDDFWQDEWGKMPPQFDEDDL